MADIAAVTTIEITARDATRPAFASLNRSFGELQNSTAAVQRALGGIASIAGVAFLVSTVRQVTEATAALDDLADITGSSVESLSRLSNQAMISGASFDELQGLVTKLAANMGGVDATSQRAQRAMQLLGVSTRDPAQALNEIAVKLNEFRDGVEKAAIAREIFGRTGPEFLASLRDIAELQDVGASVTREQAAETERLQKEYRRLGVEASGLANALLAKVVPALASTMEAMRLARSNGLSFSESLDFIGDTSIESVVDRLMRVRAEMDALRDTIAQARERTDDPFFGPQARAQIGNATLALEELTKRYATLVELQNRAALRAAAALGDTSDQTDRLLQRLQLRAPAVPGEDPVAKGNEFARLLDQIKQKAADAQLALDHAFDSEPIVEAERELEKLFASDVFKRGPKEWQVAMLAWYGALIQSQRGLRDAKAATEALATAERDLADLREELVAIDDKRVAAMDEQQAVLIEQLKRLQEEGEAIGLTKRELDALNLARIDAKIATLEQAAASRESVAGMDAETAAMYVQIQALRRIRDQTSSNQVRQEVVDQANAARDAWQRTADSIGQSLTDALLRGFESGADFAKNFRDTLVNMFQTLVLRPIIQAIVMPVAGGAASMFSGAAGANPMGGGMGGAGDFMSMFGIGNPYGSGFSIMNNSWANATSGMGPPTATGAFSTTFGSAFSNALGGAGMGFGIGTVGAQLFGNGRNDQGMQIGGAIGGAIGSVWGPIGSMVGSVIGSAIGSLFKSGGGPKSGGYASTPNLNLGPLFAADNNRYFTPTQSDDEIQKIVDTTSKTFASLYGGLGGKGDPRFGLAVGFDTDPDGTAANRAHVGAFVDGKLVYNYESGDDALGRDPELLQKTLELETKRAILAGLQASDLPEDIANILNVVAAATASSEEIDQIFQMAAAMKTVTDVLAKNPLDDALEAIATAGQSAYASLGDTADAFEDLIASYDGTTEASKQIEVATVSYYNALVNVIAGIEQLRRSIDAMFGDTIRDLTMQTLDDEGKKRYYQEQVSLLYGQLQGATDPAEIQRITGQINEYMRAAFGLLSPEEQQGLLQQYIDFARQVQTLADQRLAEAEAVAQARADQLFTQLREVLAGAAGDMKAAGQDMKSAAADMKAAGALDLQAAREPLVIQLPEPAVNA
ncbi:MAG: hypothetical protein DYH14_07480 [Betaproteobacteria bacterium PRO3]|nr:hypothetical protein [Betaproteobacteria bacterium PRO3]